MLEFDAMRKHGAEKNNAEHLPAPAAREGRCSAVAHTRNINGEFHSERYVTRAALQVFGGLMSIRKVECDWHDISLFLVKRSSRLMPVDLGLAVLVLEGLYAVLIITAFSTNDRLEPKA